MRKLLAGLWCVTFALCVALAPAPAPAPAEPLPKPKVAPPLPSAAGVVFPPTSGTYLVYPTVAHDGDTIHFYHLVEDRGRLSGIQAPELGEPTKATGKISRDFLQSLLAGRPMKATLRGREKYGRMLISLYDDKGRDLSEIMLEKNMAVRYDGKGPKP